MIKWQVSPVTRENSPLSFKLLLLHKNHYTKTIQVTTRLKKQSGFQSKVNIQRM